MWVNILIGVLIGVCLIAAFVGWLFYRKNHKKCDGCPYRGTDRCHHAHEEKSSRDCDRK